MRVSAKITKKIFQKDNFYIFGCMPNKHYEKLKLSDYGNFTITGNLPFLTEGSEYVLELKEDKTTNYGTQYKVLSVPSMDNVSFTDDNEYKFLCEVTTPQLAKHVHEAYPNFIRLILDGKEDEIDVKNIYNVKKSRFAVLKREINAKHKYFKMVSALREYDITMEDCEKLAKEYKTIENTIEQTIANPYYTLITMLKRKFLKSDMIIIEAQPELRCSSQRVEYLILHILKENELTGNSKMVARDMATASIQIAPECVSMLKDVAVESSLIYYDEPTNDMAVMGTYLAECEIANRINDLLNNPKNLNIDYTKYKTIGDNILTDEQMEILNIANSQNIGLLLGGGGSGKSFSISALIQMLDDNELTYTLLTPTGTSAKILSNYTDRKATTIHKRCLGEIPISTNFLIIDEFSFVGIDVMMMIINNTETHVKIIIVADEAQLPSISAGNILSDMINSGKIHTARLTKVFRYGIGGIATIASDTRNGKPYIGLGGTPIYENNKNSSDYKFIPINNNPINQIIESYDELLKKYDPEDILILSPYNVGEIGTYAINSKIQDIYNPILPNQQQVSYQRNGNSINFRVGDKVLNTSNWYNALSYKDYETLEQIKSNDEFDDEEFEDKVDIMNGAFGKIIKIFNDNIVVRFEDDLIVYDKSNINKLVLGNACSTFKAQGNQAMAVISIVHKQHERMLNRALIYVANSRARKQLIEIADYTVLNNALKIVITNQRNTFLKELLKG